MEHSASPDEHGTAARPATPDTRTAAQYWEDRYGTEHVWSGTVNATTAAVVGGLPQRSAAPGRALDLGCGEGADAIWLAEHGWDTIGVDISTTATERARLAALEAGLPDERIRFVAADLSAWAAAADDADDPSGGLLAGPFDLVTASFFHSTVELARTAILRRAAATLAPGGRLLIVSHAAPPPWAPEHDRHGHAELLDPAGELAALALDPVGWRTELAETRRRQVVDPDGRPAEIEDGVLLLRRAA